MNVIERMTYKPKHAAKKENKPNLKVALISVFCLITVLSSYTKVDDNLLPRKVNAQERITTISEDDHSPTNLKDVQLIEKDSEEQAETIEEVEKEIIMSPEDYINRYYEVSKDLSIEDKELLLQEIENEGNYLYGEEELFKEFIGKEKKSVKLNKELDYIYTRYNINEQQFREICATTLAEAAENYEDQYAVVSTMLNRTCSKIWTQYISEVLGDNKGYNIYYQATAPTQYVAYKNSRYYQKLELDYDAYRAIIDCLVSGIPSHDYLSFKENKLSNCPSEQLAPHGNYYHDRQSSSDKFDPWENVPQYSK